MEGIRCKDDDYVVSTNTIECSTQSTTEYFVEKLDSRESI